MDNHETQTAPMAGGPSSNDVLEPCMYCGSIPKIEDFGFGEFFQVACTNSDCGALGPWRTDKGDAAREWNGKHITAEKGSCPTCKFTKPVDCAAPDYLAMSYEEQQKFWDEAQHPCRLWVEGSNA